MERWRRGYRSLELRLSVASSPPLHCSIPHHSRAQCERASRRLVRISGVEPAWQVFPFPRASRSVVSWGVQWPCFRMDRISLFFDEFLTQDTRGQHRKCTSLGAIEVVRHMAGRFPDELIAATLNRLGLRTGVGNTWNKQRVYSLRHDRQLPSFSPDDPRPMVTLAEAAKRLKVSAASIRRMIEEKMLPASQVVECAPWEIPTEALDSELARKAVSNIRNRATRPRTQIVDGQQAMFSES